MPSARIDSDILSLLQVKRLRVYGVPSASSSSSSSSSTSRRGHEDVTVRDVALVGDYQLPMIAANSHLSFDFPRRWCVRRYLCCKHPQVFCFLTYIRNLNDVFASLHVWLMISALIYRSFAQSSPHYLL